MLSLRKETDYVRDTSDTEAELSNDIEYEPATEPEDELAAPFDDDDSSGHSDEDIISTRVIEVSVGSEDLVFADSERTDADGRQSDNHSDRPTDEEADLFDFGRCARCRAANDNTIYSYCQKCFQVRKSFFPPRPRPKHKRIKRESTPKKRPRKNSRTKRETSLEADVTTEIPRSFSQDSGIETSSQGTSSQIDAIPVRTKRRADSIDNPSKRAKYDSSESDSEPVAPLAKTISDPSITIENVNVTKRIISDTLKEIETKDLCVMCVSEPKSGVFVHGRLAHICCCYKCAVKVWVKARRCPVCNCKVSNVLRAVIM